MSSSAASGALVVVALRRAWPAKGEARGFESAGFRRLFCTPETGADVTRRGMTRVYIEVDEDRVE